MSGKIFKPFVVDDPTAQVKGINIKLFINCREGSESYKIKCLAESGIINPKEDAWYPEQQWLNALKIIHKLGPMNLKMISKQIIKESPFPTHIKTPKEAFNMVNDAYHFNNKGDIGYYKVLPCDDPKKIIMETNHPYPIPFDEGIFLGILERFSPPGKNLTLLSTMSHKTNLNGTLEYTITWIS